MTVSRHRAPAARASAEPAARAGSCLAVSVRHPRHATWVPACLPCDGYKRHMCMYTVKVYEATRSIPVTGTEITDIYCIKPKGDGRKCPLGVVGVSSVA